MRPTPSDRLLDAADALFYRDGIRATGIDAVIERADVAKASLYSNFGSKDGLIAAYIERRSHAFRASVESELARTGGTPRAQLEVVVDMLAAVPEAPDFAGCPIIKTGAEIADPNHPARIAGSDHRSWLRSLLADLATKAGAHDPQQLASQLALLYDSIMVAGHLDPDSGAPQRAREVARILIEHALA